MTNDLARAVGTAVVLIGIGIVFMLVISLLVLLLVMTWHRIGAVL